MFWNFDPFISLNRISCFRRTVGIQCKIITKILLKKACQMTQVKLKDSVVGPADAYAIAFFP